MTSDSERLYDRQKYCLGQIQALDKDIDHEHSFIFYEITEVDETMPKNGRINYKVF